MHRQHGVEGRYSALDSPQAEEGGATMLTLLRPTFPHRHNADGSYDSICSVCYATVASVEKECQLAAPESMHKCDPAILYQVSQYRIPAGYPQA